MAMLTSALCKTNTNGSPFNWYVRKKYFSVFNFKHIMYAAAAAAKSL